MWLPSHSITPVFFKASPLGRKPQKLGTQTEEKWLLTLPVPCVKIQSSRGNLLLQLLPLPLPWRTGRRKEATHHVFKHLSSTYFVPGSALGIEATMIIHIS